MSSTNNEHRANLCSPKSLGTPAVSARPLLATAAASSSRPPSFGAFLAGKRYRLVVELQPVAADRCSLRCKSVLRGTRSVSQPSYVHTNTSRCR